MPEAGDRLLVFALVALIVVVGAISGLAGALWLGGW